MNIQIEVPFTTTVKTILHVTAYDYEEGTYDCWHAKWNETAVATDGYVEFVYDNPSEDDDFADDFEVMAQATSDNLNSFFFLYEQYPHLVSAALIQHHFDWLMAEADYGERMLTQQVRGYLPEQRS